MLVGIPSGQRGWGGLYPVLFVQVCRNESDALYQRWAIPAPAKPLFEAATANFTPATKKKGLTSVQMTIAAAPPGSGQCTQVGYVKDNPGYDPKASPAGPLKEITAETGGAC